MVKKQKRFGKIGTAGLTLSGIGLSILAGTLISRGVDKVKYVDISEEDEEEDVLAELRAEIDAM